MIGTWRMVLIVVSLLCLSLSGMGTESKEVVKQQLVLRANLDSDRIEVGTELRPQVSLLNVSGEALKLEYTKPSLVVPEIWDAALNKRVLNAPTFVYDQICARQVTTLAPNEELVLSSLPVFIGDQPLPAVSDGRVRGFWHPPPGQFTLKYSVSLKDFLPGADGELHAKGLAITVVDPSKKLTDEQAIALAKENLANVLKLAPGVKVNVERNQKQIIVTFGSPPAHGVRGADYIARIIINAKTNKVEQRLVGP